MNDTNNNLADDVFYINNFIDNDMQLFAHLRDTVIWNEQMRARKTASFGKAYNYSQISYPYQEFLPELSQLIDSVATKVGFRPNNCLINYYSDGKSKMGFHSDQTDILVENTGVAIVSIGEQRILKFRRIDNHEEKVEFLLESGSLFYMSAKVQDIWQHAIPKANTDNPRMSLTLREIL